MSVKAAIVTLYRENRLGFSRIIHTKLCPRQSCAAP